MKELTNKELIDLYEKIEEFLKSLQDRKESVEK